MSLLEISARIKKVIFHAERSGYTVLECAPLQKGADPMMVVGCFPLPSVGQEGHFTGKWEESLKHGRQFVAQQVTLKPGSLPMEQFLIHYIHGVGPSTAQKLLSHFGEDLIAVLNETPARLKEVEGIGQHRYEKLLLSWQAQKASLKSLAFLITHGLHFFQANKVYRKYQSKTIEAIQENPYRLIDEVDGIGFSSADNLALKLGVAKEDPIRLHGGVQFVLKEAQRDGHCGLFQSTLIQKAKQLLHVDESLLELSIEEANRSKTLIKDTLNGTPSVFISVLYEQEKAIATGVHRLLGAPLKDSQALLDSLNEISHHKDITLSTEQFEAASKALSSHVFILTGGPGVGKTTLVRALTQVFKANHLSFALCAPTGRAAKRMSESTGCEAMTLHRLLEYDPFTHSFGYHKDLPLPYQVIIVDEASMLDVPLCATLVAAVKTGARLMFVGDVDQLASVGPGDVLRSLISSQKVPTVSLETIFRQALTSQIVVNAHRVNQGLMPQVNKEEERDFYLIRLDERKQPQKKVLSLISERLPQGFGLDPYTDIQLLTPMNKGPLGVEALNTLLQASLNPNVDGQEELKLPVGSLRVNDKVIQVINNYEKQVFNGDVGIIDEIDFARRKIQVMYDAKEVSYDFKEREQLRLAYALSVHKSQGSEYKAVVVILSLSQRIMLKRNLLYTAMTRGKRFVVVMSSSEALSLAVRHGEVKKRINKLEEWLQNE